MTVDERTRHALYTRLEQVLGEEHAVALMAHLPPTGWGDVATLHDVDQRFAAVDARFDQLERHLGERIDLRTSELAASIKADLRAEMAAQTRTFAFATLGSMTTIAALAFAAARLAA